MAFRIELDGAAHEVEIVSLRPLTLRIDGVECVTAAPDGGEDGRHALTLDGARLDFARAHAGPMQYVRIDGRTFEARLIDPRDENEAGAHGFDHVRAPMPGAVVHVHREPGARIARGDALVTIESMKLQMTLNAPRDGVLASLARAVGETFDKDEILAELEPLEGI